MTNFRKSTLAPSAALVATALAACTSVSPGEAPPAADVQQYAGYLHVTASPRTREEVKDIWSVAEYILAPHNAALAPHDLVITPASVTRLLALGVPLRVEPDDVQSMINASSQEVVGSAGRPHAASDLFGPWFAKVQQLD